MSDKIVIHSYRRVFEVDRRIYRVDRWAVPVPGGVPLSGVWWFLVAEVAVVLLTLLPGLGELLGALPWPLVYLIIPTLVAIGATQATPDGRPAHQFALAWLRLRTRAPRRCGDITVPLEGDSSKWARRFWSRADADTPTLQRARICGPVRVTSNVPVRTTSGWRGGLTLRGDPNGDPVSLSVAPERPLKVKS